MTLTPQGSVRASMMRCNSALNLVAPLQHLGQHRPADHVAQRGLRRPVDRRDIVGDVERRLLGSMTFQNSTASTSTGTVSRVIVFSALNVLVMTRMSIQKGVVSMTGHDEEQARALEAAELSEPQHDDPLPLIGDLDRIGDDRGDDEAYGRNHAAWEIALSVHA